MSDRFIVGAAHVIHTATMGELVRPCVLDTEKGWKAVFIPGADVFQIAADLNEFPSLAKHYMWQSGGTA